MTQSLKIQSEVMTKSPILYHLRTRVILKKKVIVTVPMKVLTRPKACLSSLARLSSKRTLVRARPLLIVKRRRRRAVKLRKRKKMNQKMNPLLTSETPRNQANHPTKARKAATLSL